MGNEIGNANSDDNNNSVTNHSGNNHNGVGVRLVPPPPISDCSDYSTASISKASGNDDVSTWDNGSGSGNAAGAHLRYYGYCHCYYYRHYHH